MNLEGFRVDRARLEARYGEQSDESDVTRGARHDGRASGTHWISGDRTVVGDPYENRS